MQRYDLDIWISHTANLIALVAVGGAFATYWAQSACSSTQRQAMFVRRVAA